MSKKEHYKHSLLKLAKNENLILGIYNYCDRWCERCTMTDRCLTFAQEQAMKDENEQQNHDEANKAFWEQIRMTWEVTMELIEADAKRFGIDLNNLEEVEIPEHIESFVEIQAKKYSTKIYHWLQENQKLLTEKAEQFILLNNGESSLLKLKDAVEVIQWYSVFISAKVHRAHFDLEERQQDLDDEYNVFSDNLGSAKIAMIAIERSMEALSVLYNELKEKEDDILKFLVQLSGIKKGMLKTFPSAMEFKRPGFDD